MADLNSLNTYTPDLVGKGWDDHGARETQEALQRLASGLATIISELEALGIVLGADSPLVTFYQTVMKDNTAIAQRVALDFTGHVDVSDTGDRTVVAIGAPPPASPDGSTEDLNDYLLYKATGNYALRMYPATTFR